MLKEALFYNKIQGKSVQCYLCGHRCVIDDGRTGLCAVRQNTQGSLYSLNYGEVVAVNIDPIEKKPLFHFLPGTATYSLACTGCNFQCDFCQNWQISQVREAKKAHIRKLLVSPEDIVDNALVNKCPSVSYTYTEPTIYFEYAYECAILAHKKGLYNIFVTNGFMAKEALLYIHEYLDAANVDLKSFREDFYRTVCKARLGPVLDTIRAMKEYGVWVEITTLIIPGANDSDSELGQIARFISDLDKNMPWHVSRFHPDYKRVSDMPTSQDTLRRAFDIGKNHGLKNIYIGNVTSELGENTHCPQCGKTVIERAGFSVKENRIKQGCCGYCNEKIAGFGL